MSTQEIIRSQSGDTHPPVEDSPIAEAARKGLAATGKYLPAWLFYDRQGSWLFEQITVAPEYYLTRTERAIFAAQAENVVSSARALWSEANPDRANGSLRFLELGAGTATKTGILLGAAVRVQGPTDYLPIDVSATAIEEACATIAAEHPDVYAHPQVANYVTERLRIPAHDGPTLALYIGSSIGNFSTREAVAVLRNLREQLRTGDSLLLGTDLVKDTAVLEAAYCDAEGVTEAFNLNVLRRLNRELGANFDLSAFEHVAYFNAKESRIEMHLRSVRQQTVRLAGLGMSVEFRAMECIHTENSYKFTTERIAELLKESGFSVERTFQDDLGYFAVTLASVR